MGGVRAYRANQENLKKILAITQVDSNTWAN